MNWKNPSMAHFTSVRALVFDLDGTLLNSEVGLQMHWICSYRWLASHASPDWMANSADIMLQRALNWALEARAEALQLHNARALFGRYYQRNAGNWQYMFPDLAIVPGELTAHNIPLALFTNKATVFLRH